MTGLRLAGGPGTTTIVWTSAAPGAGSGTVHDVLRGSVALLPVTPGGTAVCVIPGTPLSTASDTGVPAAGTAW